MSLEALKDKDKKAKTKWQKMHTASTLKALEKDPAKAAAYEAKHPDAGGTIVWNVFPVGE